MTTPNDIASTGGSGTEQALGLVLNASPQAYPLPEYLLDVTPEHIGGAFA